MRCVPAHLPRWYQLTPYISLFLTVTIAACTLHTAQPIALGSDEEFHHTQRKRSFTSVDQLAAFDIPNDDAYRLGEEDIVTIEVGDRPELSRRHVMN
jgi:hypothetical protein